MIPATVNIISQLPTHTTVKRKVAGYARVSTDSDEQFTSYEAQVDSYTNYIQSKPEWEFVNVYTDEGISGLNTKNRDGFNRMIANALEGNINLIVTKSVFRFERNTVDSLTTIRKLKEVGCECYFKKENIWTFDGKGELLLTIMSSLAQEESRSISENVTWGQRKRFAKGEFSLAYSHFLGYEKGENGKLQVNPEQAETVRLIFKLFFEGKTTQGVANFLMQHNIPSPAGKKKWSASTISSILSNEKYKGDALLQKRFTADFLTKELRVNQGEVPQYYVEGNHEAIISPMDFDLVQEEIARRKQLGRTYSDKAFHSKLICNDCGGFYGKKVWHSTSQYRREIYQCNSKFNNKCTTPNISEDEIKTKFLIAYNELMQNKNGVIADCKMMLQAIDDTSALLLEIQMQEEIMNAAIKLMKEHALKSAKTAFDQELYAQETEQIEKRYNVALKRYTTLKDEMLIAQRKAKDIKSFISALQEKPIILDVWDDNMWSMVVEKCIVHSDGKLYFYFRNKMEITV